MRHELGQHSPLSASTARRIGQQAPRMRHESASARKGTHGVVPAGDFTYS